MTPGEVGVPLTSAQGRVWFAMRLRPRTGEHAVHATLSLPAPPSRARLRAAVAGLIRRHDALRLRVAERDGAPRQFECGALAPPVTWHDVSSLAPGAARLQAAEITAAACAALDPGAWPAFRAVAITLPGGRADVVLAAHRLFADHWSIALLSRELAALLAGERLDPAGPARFLDHARRQPAGDGGEHAAAGMSYWLDRLREPPVLDVPRDRPRPAAPAAPAARVPVTGPAGLAGRLRALGAAEGTTPDVVLLAAFKVLLLRLTGQTDLIVGTWSPGRDRPGTAGLAGCLANPVALRTALSGAPDFRECLRRVLATMAAAQQHQDVPFEHIVAQLGLPRDVGASPVFQAFFTLREAGPQPPGSAAPAGITLDSGSAAACDLALVITGTGPALTGFLEYSPDLFGQATAARYAGIYLMLLTSLTAHPGRPVTEHALVPAPEQDRILHQLNPYQRPGHRYHTMAGPFEEQAAWTPDAVALIAEEGTLSYAGLNERANRLAHFLRAAGAGRGTVVALCLERGLDMVTALYAAAKSGAAYLPLDTELPDARLAFMLTDVAPLLVLTDSASRHRIPGGPWQCVSIDAESHRWADQPAANPACEGPPSHLLHLLYTSGSTGRPKAVAYPVEGAIADILWLQRSYPFGPGDAAILKTSYGFDVSIWEIFWPLYFGARLVICPPGGHRDPGQLIELIDRHQVTTIFLIPTLMRVFLDVLPPGHCRSLRWVFCGGEPVTPWIRDTCHARLPAALINCYGPTEAGCVTDMVLPHEPGAPVPLGRPAANFRLYVLDEDRRVAPVGIPGEAYLGGEVGLAHGYFRRPGLTAERFLPDPYGPPGSRMYQTGDICRYRDDGVLEHLGRMGRQVKVRGMRIELGEVENVLSEHGDVDDCVVCAAGDGAQHIVAFVVARDGTGLSRQGLAAHAARLLPRHMVPESIVTVGVIPSNVNGKTDYDALLRAWRDMSQAEERELMPPSGDFEAALVRIYERVLGTDGISVTDNFFELGGHSLLIFRLLDDCARELRVAPEVTDVFTASIRELAGIMQAAPASGAGLVALRPRPDKPAVVFVHAASGSAFPFVPLAQSLAGEFSVYALQAPADGAGPATIQDMAARYRAAVEAALGAPPLILAGWSMGGCIAVEMTRQWQDQGQRPAATLMLDTWLPPPALHAAADRERVRAAILDLDVLAAEGLPGSVAAGTTGGDPPGDGSAETTAETARLRRVIDRNRAAFLDYDPGWLDGEVVLLRATEEFPGMDARLRGGYLAGDRGWGERIGTLVVAEIGGNHFTLAAEAHAPALAAAITRVAAGRVG